MTKTYINIDGDIRDASSLTVPTDRIFRESWCLEGDVIKEDMALSLEIQKNNIRLERAPRLQALDVEYMKALESGYGEIAIAQEKQVLRDITSDPRLEAASTPDELKLLNLKALLGE